MIEVAEGVYARIFHYRNFEGVEEQYTKAAAVHAGIYPEHKILPQGGLTVAHLCDEQGEPLGVPAGLATCSDKDNYSRKLGRQIAIGRAKASHASPGGGSSPRSSAPVAARRAAT